jgi:hypothetical protein
MRKINFRVWHKKESRWLDPWSEEDPMLCLKDFGNGCEVYLYDRQSKDWTNKDFFKDDDWWVGKEMVKFNNGIFGFSDEDNDRHVPLFECKRIEVIGNIFEGVDK